MEKTKVEKIIEGLQILSRHTGELAAEHDIIICAEDSTAITTAEREELKRLGWFVSGEYFGCWCLFV